MQEEQAGMECCAGSRRAVSKRETGLASLQARMLITVPGERASHSPLFPVREEHGEQELEIFPLLDRFSR